MSNFDYLNSWFTYQMNTRPGKDSGRLKTDSQQTSFEENRQFRFFEDLSNQEYSGVDNSVGSGDVLVYLFTAVNPVNIQSRILNGFSGGRKYLVFPADGNETITGGSFVDVSDQIAPISNNLFPDLDELPSTGVTVQKRIATSFESTTKPRTGVAYKTDSNNNRVNSTYSPGGERAGIGAGSAFYLVLFDIAAVGSSEFLLEISWEEEF